MPRSSWEDGHLGREIAGLSTPQSYQYHFLLYPAGNFR
jgi:hypothetical protein